ncbi:MAG TPA: BamA/TamA family outer membrane protein [Candidatus Acidoferrum sp.]|nr:BamA/TamA family outer membrane protein [Candidatus Acidoferrum sp.]
MTAPARGRATLTGILLLASGTALAQTAAPPVKCTELAQPATAGYDFTSTLNRWGGKNGYGATAGMHRVNSIAVNTLPIFDENDPRENNFLFRWANAVHIDTRPDVITDQLIFKKAQWVDDHMLAESERILRSRQYVSDAAIRVLRQCGDDVDLEVVSREVWTLTPELNFKSTGGQSTSSIGIRDSNILGSGQLVDLKYKDDPERSSWGISYKNPNIGGTHATLSTELADNSDGHHYVVEAAQPFYSLDDKHGWRLAWESTTEVLNQYSFGQRISSLDHSLRSADVSYGESDGLIDGKVSRFSGGVRMLTQTWQQVPGQVAPAGFVPALDLYYPYVQYDYIEDNFVTGYNISQIHRTEDLQLGLQVRSRVGYAGEGGGNVMFDGDLSDTLLYEPGMLLQLMANWDMRWNRDRARFEDSEAKAELSYQRELDARRTLFIALTADKVLNLNNGKQLLMGGDTGLRGYDNNFIFGNGSVQFTAEHRYFTDFHLLELARVGFALFYDAGRMWGNSLPFGDRLYQDVGIGLRLAPSRSESGQVVHIDLAWPLSTDAPGVAGRQFAVQVKKTF